MSTIIESINKITEIKRDLNDILRENGLEGGDVFSDYPDKFRELFRVITSMIDSSASGYVPDETNVTTVVPAPSLRQYQNVVYVTNNMDEATIYYFVNTDSGNHDIGLTRLEKGNSIVVSEPSTVYVYAQYRAEKSSTVSIYVPWNPEVVPDPPVIVRNGTTVTMACNAGDEIYYATGSVGMSEWQLYTGPITVERYENIWAFAQNYRGRSDSIYDEAPEPLPLPDTPIIQCSLNVVEITCGTEGATIYYKKQTDKYFIEYTGPFTITQSDYYEAKAMKDGLYGGEAIEYCRYVEEPTAPVITCADNAVSITCEPATETIIYYKIDDGEWEEYNGPILLTETVTITAYGNHYGVIGPSTTQECVYVAPIDVDEPEFTQIVNTVSITCDTEGADIWYRQTGNEQWYLYRGPFDITEDIQFEAYATLGDDVSDTVTYNAHYVDEVADAPAAPVGVCVNNIVTMSCDTPNAEIYYRDINEGYWTLYEAPFEITETHTYVIYSTKYGLVTYGIPFTAEYNAEIPEGDHKTPSPTIAYNPVNQTATIVCSNSQAVIYYSFDNSNWNLYRNPVNVMSEGYIYAYAVVSGWNNSDTVMKYCAIPGTVSTPVITFDKQTNKVSIATITSNATILYSFDNSTWNLYSGAFAITQSVTVYAKAERTDWIPSQVTSLYCKYTEGGDVDYSDCLVFTALSDGTIKLVASGHTSFGTVDSLYVARNNEPYVQYYWGDNSDNNTTITINVFNRDVIKVYCMPNTLYFFDDNIQRRKKTFSAPYEKNSNGNDTSFVYKFQTTARVDLSGNVMALISAWDPGTGTQRYVPRTFFYGDDTVNGAPAEGCFSNLFNSCNIRSAKNLNLPADILPKGVYKNMFSFSSIVEAPNLPARTIGTEACSNMFGLCSSLTTPPAMLYGTTIGDYGYSTMFQQCNALRTTPLFAHISTAGLSSFNQMFRMCNALASASTIMIDTLTAERTPTNPNVSGTYRSNGLYGIFWNCPNLRSVDIWVNTMGADTTEYDFYLFENCTSLNTVKIMLTNYRASINFKSLLGGCASTGTFIKNKNVDDPWYMKDGWTIQNV